MKMSDLVIDWDETLGNNGTLMAVETTWAYKYENDKKTDEIIGLNVACVVPKLKFDKVTVRVMGLVKVPEGLAILDNPKLVQFDGLDGKIYLDYS